MVNERRMICLWQSRKEGGNILVACYEPLPQNSTATEEGHESPVSTGSASVTIETCCLQNVVTSTNVFSDIKWLALLVTDL